MREHARMRAAARKRVRRDCRERRVRARTHARTHACTHTDMTSRVSDVFAARASWSVNISSVRARTVMRVRVRACTYRPSRARPATGSLCTHTFSLYNVCLQSVYSDRFSLCIHTCTYTHLSAISRQASDRLYSSASVDPDGPCITAAISRPQ
jgi:hypothetical protein